MAPTVQAQTFQAQAFVLQEITCAGASNGQLAVQTNAGIPPYVYNWSTGQQTGSLAGLSAGTYQVTVVDGSGQSDTSLVVLNDPLALQGSLQVTSNYGPFNTSCAGASDGSATLQSLSGGQPPYQYLWSNGQSTSTATGLSGGTQSLVVTDAQGCTWVGNITLQAPPPLQLNIASSGNISCFGGANGQLAVQVLGGRAPYQYLWSNGQTIFTAQGFSAGTHSVTVTDANGCQATANRTLTQPLPLQLGFSSSQPASCSNRADGRAVVNSVGGVAPRSIVWSNGELGDTAFALPPNQPISAVVTDANGCVDSLSLSVSAPTPLSLNLQTLQGINCAGDSTASIQAMVSGGTLGYQFQWSTGETGQALSGLPAGNYSLTLSDANTCTDTAQVAITAPNPLQLSVVSTSPASCFGQADGQAAVSVSGGSLPYSFFWVSGETTASATQLLGGNRGLTVTDANGCTESLSVLIDQPDDLVLLNNGVQHVSCFGGSNGAISVTAVGGQDPYSYNWSNGGTTRSQNNLSAGAYTVIVTDANGCTAAFAAIVEQPSDSLELSVLAAEDASCAQRNDGFVDLQASGGTPNYSIIWAGTQQSTTGTLTAGNLAAGNYIFTLLDARLCKDTLHWTIDAPVPLSLNAGFDHPSCFGEQDGRIFGVAGGGTPPYLYALEGSVPSGDSLFTNLGSGSYQLLAEDTRGCSDSLLLTLVDPDSLELFPSPDLQLTMGESGQLSVDFPVNVTIPPSVQWQPSLYLDCDTCEAVITRPLESIRYEVEVTDLVGCVSRTAIDVQVGENRTVFIPEIFSPNGDGQNDGFTAYGSVGVEYIEQMQVFDRWGNLLFSRKELPIGNEALGWDGREGGKLLNPGVFVYQIEIRFVDGKRRRFVGDVLLVH